MLMPT